MNRADWSAPSSWDEVKARANGRSRWNTTRRFRARVRRVQVAKRLIVLQQEAWAKGSLEWMPRGVIAQLANEFGCNRQTISKDIKAIDAWPASTPPPPPRKKLRDPRFAWAYSRPRPTTLPRRMTVRLPEDLYQALITKGDPSRLVRQAVEAYLATGTHHTTDDCARMVAQACEFDTQDRLVRTAERLHLPLIEVLASLILLRSKEAVGS